MALATIACLTRAMTWGLVTILVTLSPISEAAASQASLT